MLDLVQSRVRHPRSGFIDILVCWVMPPPVTVHVRGLMVVSHNRGGPQYRPPKYYSPYYRDPQKGYP